MKSASPRNTPLPPIALFSEVLSLCPLRVDEDQQLQHCPDLLTPKISVVRVGRLCILEPCMMVLKSQDLRDTDRRIILESEVSGLYRKTSKGEGWEMGAAGESGHGSCLLNKH